MKIPQHVGQDRNGVVIALLAGHRYPTRHLFVGVAYCSPQASIIGTDQAKHITPNDDLCHRKQGFFLPMILTTIEACQKT